VISTKFLDGYEESDDCDVLNNDSDVIIQAANIEPAWAPGRISNLRNYKAIKGLPFKQSASKQSLNSTVVNSITDSDLD